MKKILLTLLFILAANALAEEENTGFIEIVVTDADTKLPIEGVSVYIRSESASRLMMASSNKDGSVKFIVPE